VAEQLQQIRAILTPVQPDHAEYSGREAPAVG
jgi:hypothetical protein